MKNLFDYATKELSQDAFLRWLFENFDCEDNSLKTASQSVLKRLCKIPQNEKITNVTTYSQWHKVDIFILVETDKRKIALFIEDKVFSSVHDNQLDKYNNIIENSIKNKGWDLNRLGCSSENAVKVFYKTLWLSEEEITAVKNAGWEIYDIFRINELFKELSNTNCVLLNQYIEHIKEIEQIFSTKDMPKTSEKGLDLIKWKAYFEFELIPRLKNDFKNLDFGVGISAYNYTYLYIQKSNPDKEKTPYIEIRSRDILEDGLSATILCYGVDYEKNGYKIKQVDGLVETAPNHLFLQKFKRRDEPKQLGRTEKTNENIVVFLKKCIEDYEYIMKNW